MSEQEQAPRTIDLGSILHALSVGEQSCRAAREAVCMQQILAQNIEASKSQVVAAGTAVLGQVMNGQAKVFKPGSLEDPAVQQHLQMSELIHTNMKNAAQAGDIIKQMLAIMKGEAPART